MTQEQKETLEKYVGLYDMYEKYMYIKNYTQEAFDKLLAIYIEKISAKHTFTHWCGTCRTDLVLSVYRWYFANDGKEWNETRKVVTPTFEGEVITGDKLKPVYVTKFPDEREVAQPIVNTSDPVKEEQAPKKTRKKKTN